MPSQAKLLSADGMLTFVSSLVFPKTLIYSLKEKSMSPLHHHCHPSPPLSVSASLYLSDSFFHLYLLSSFGEKLSEATYRVLSLFFGPDT